MSAPDDLMDGVRELDDAAPGYIAAKRYFTGNVPEFFASKKLRNKLSASGERYRVNVAKKAVTAVTDRMEISSIAVPDDETATRVLREQWDDNEMPLEAPLIHRHACEFGDAYVFIWPGETSAAGTPLSVDIEYSGPLTTRAIYDEESPRKIKYVVKRWTLGSGDKKRTRVNLYYFGDPESSDDPGRIERWVTVAGTKGTDPEHWQPYDEDGEPDVLDFPAAYPAGPIVFHFRTDRPYGVPLHKDAYGPQDALNKITAAHMNAIDYMVTPQRWALADDADNDDGDDFDDDFDDTTPDPTITADTDKPKPKLEAGPGKVWWLTGTKAVGEFSPADSDAFLKPADFFLRLMAVASDMPLHFYDPGGDQPSGDARRTAEGTLVKKIQWLQLSFESTWSALGVAVLKMLGYEAGRVHVTWAPAAQNDDLDAWQTAKAKLDAGVPVRQVLMEMGYTDEQVDEWLTQSDEQQLSQKVQLAGQMAGMLRDFGTASQLGTVSPDSVQQMLGSMMAKMNGAQQQ